MPFGISVQVANPDEALLVYGVKGAEGENSSAQMEVHMPGSRVTIMGLFKKSQRFPLNLITVPVVTRKVFNKQELTVNITGVVQLHVEQTREAVVKAAQLFGAGSREHILQQIRVAAQETLEGNQREIIGETTLEALAEDRGTFTHKVEQVCREPMDAMGLKIISYTLTDVTDDNGYLSSLGEIDLAAVQKKSRVAKAENDEEAGKREAQSNAAVRTTTAEAQQESGEREAESTAAIRKVQAEKDLQTAEAEKALALARQVNALEVNEAKARAEMAEDLTKAVLRVEVAEKEADAERERMRVVAESPVLRAERIMVGMTGMIAAQMEPLAKVGRINMFGSTGNGQGGGLGLGDISGIMRMFTVLNEVLGLNIGNAGGAESDIGSDPVAVSESEG